MDPAAGAWPAEELSDAVDHGLGEVLGVHTRRLLLGFVGLFFWAFTFAVISLSLTPGLSRTNGNLELSVVEKIPWVFAPTLASNSTTPKPSASTRTTLPVNFSSDIGLS